MQGFLSENINMLLLKYKRRMTLSYREMYWLHCSFAEWTCFFDFSNTSPVYKVIKSVSSQSSSSESPWPTMWPSSRFSGVRPRRAVCQLGGLRSSFFWAPEDSHTSGRPGVTGWPWSVPSTAPRRWCHSHTATGCHGGAASSGLRGVRREKVITENESCWHQQTR